MFVHATPSRVFKFISKPDLLTTWFMDRAVLPATRGGRYVFEWKGGPAHSGKVLDYVRGKRISLSWQWPGLEKLGRTRLSLSVEPKAGGTVVRFTHSGFRRAGAWVALYEGAIRGWTYFMMNLKAVLETGRDLRSPYDW